MSDNNFIKGLIVIAVSVFIYGLVIATTVTLTMAGFIEPSTASYLLP